MLLAHDAPSATVLYVPLCYPCVGVKYDVRRMHVGDFVWIAKESVALRPGEGVGMLSLGSPIIV